MGLHAGQREDERVRGASARQEKVLTVLAGGKDKKDNESAA
jgi:hypothetical protein